jgi:surfeit locus 1 family protein
LPRHCLTRNRTRSIKPLETKVPSLLRSGRWWVAHLLVIAVCALFVSLGLWQLRRLDERQLQNSVWQSRVASVPLPIDEVLSGAGSDLESLEYRPVIVRGTFVPDQEVLVRSQVWNGTAGFHVITPLVREDGSAVLVNRGWVPLEMDDVPVPVKPPEGEVELIGTIRLSQTRGSVGPADPPAGNLIQVARVDIDRIARQLEWPVLPVYVVGREAGETGLPVAIETPDFADQGPHLAYAVQWFAFALISLIGYLFLLRRARSRRDVGPDSESFDNLG